MRMGIWGLGLSCVLALGCGGTEGNPFLDGGGSGNDGMTADGTGGDGTTDDTGADTGADTSPPCDNLECQIVDCMTADGTTITGTVFDPAGARGVYNAFVYIPNRPLDPIMPGLSSSCNACSAPASGKPLVSAQTDSKGNFTLKNVPSGMNIPLVVQVGKFRHKAVLSTVTQCTANMAPKAATTLPSKQGPDDSLPQMAITTGCDNVECFLQRIIGIDPSEFTDPTGKGRVHVYRGVDVQQGFAGTPGMAANLWGNTQTMKGYDMLVQACECNSYDRGGSYANMKAYLDAGGRFFGTHYQYNWFAPPTGPMDYQAQATWNINNPIPSAPFSIDTTFPRGKAYSDWLAANMVTTNNQLALTDTRGEVVSVTNGASRSRWIYNQSPVYFTFNTPTTAMTQCGRVAFSDIHLEGGLAGSFPTYCANSAMGHDVNEKAMEFLFFDLAGCVQDDTKAAVSPPTQ